MTVKEVIEYLKTLPQDKECAIAINESAGFADYDYVQIHPLESILFDDIKNSSGFRYHYYGLDENDTEKVLFYTFP